MVRPHPWNYGSLIANCMLQPTFRVSSPPRAIIRLIYDACHCRATFTIHQRRANAAFRGDATAPRRLGRLPAARAKQGRRWRSDDFGFAVLMAGMMMMMGMVKTMVVMLTCLLQ